MPNQEPRWQNSAVNTLSAMGRLVILRPLLFEQPLQTLYALLTKLLSGDAPAAADLYHDLSNLLLTGGFRRVTGDLFRDYLYFILFEHENMFALYAARNHWDEPLSAAMQNELKNLSPLFELTSANLRHWINECYHETRARPKQGKDDIARLSSVAWSGGSIRALPHLSLTEEKEALPPVPPPHSFDDGISISWRYQNETRLQEDDYVADTALEELYRRLDMASDRGLLLDDIWSFHATYGTGLFIKSRLFTISWQGKLITMPPSILPDEDNYTFYQTQREQIMRNAICFMRNEPFQYVLLNGGAGVGKTTQIFSLCRELPALRLVYCGSHAYQYLIALLPKLLQQPLKFLVFLDDFNEDTPYWPQLKAAISAMGKKPENLLFAAAACDAKAPFFPLHIQLPPPQLKEFIELVQLLLLRDGQKIDFESIQNACIDYAALAGTSGGSPLSFQSAHIIAESFQQE